MNLIPVIREALELHENEEFQIKDETGVSQYIYRFTNKDMQVNIRGSWESNSNGVIGMLVKGQYEVVKLPFKPNEYEAYYFVNFYFGTVEVSAFSKDFTADVIRVNSGNCYRTKEEAENHVDEWMTKVYGKDWRELLK